MKKAFYPGSFDPIHLGHLDVISQALKAFDEVVVGIAHTSSKKSGMFSLDRRIDMVIAACGELGLEGVEVLAFEGTAVAACSQFGAKVIVKGVRSGSDLDDELVQANINRKIDENIPTLLLPGTTDFGLISSQYVRQLSVLGAPLGGLVPASVVELMSVDN